MKPKQCSGCPYKKKCIFDAPKGARLVIKDFRQCVYYRQIKELYEDRHNSKKS